MMSISEPLNFINYLSVNNQINSHNTDKINVM